MNTKDKYPSILEKMSTDDKYHFLSLLDICCKDSVIAIDGGFAVISEVIENNNFSPKWGKLNHNNQSVGVSETEISTFVDMCELYRFINNAYNIKPIPFLTLSDLRGYSRHNTSNYDYNENLKFDLQTRVGNNKNLYIPCDYLQTSCIDHQFINDLQIVLQHEFSSFFKRKIKGKYRGIKRSKKTELEKHEMHYNIYQKCNGWILFSAKSEYEKCYYLSTPIFRLDSEIISNKLVRNLCLEGGIGVSYFADESLSGQFCGTISASRLLYIAKKASEISKTPPAKSIVTIHIFDKADDHSIDRSLVLGLLAVQYQNTSNFHILIIKDKDQVSVITTKNSFFDYEQYNTFYNKYLSGLTKHQFLNDMEAAKERIFSKFIVQSCQDAVVCMPSIQLQPCLL